MCNIVSKFFNQVMKRLLTVVCLLVGLVALAEVPGSEKQILVDLYESTNGKHWVRKWNLKEPVDTWYGVTVRDNRVVGIELFHNNLMGPLPESLGQLQQLETLNVAFNNLTGQLPATIFKLRKLRVLKLEMNRLKGELPETVGNLTELRELSVFNNFLSGRIPNGIGSLKRLEVLNLSSNQFFGRIPESIGELNNLRALGLFENQLYGDIPESMGNLAQLKELVLSNNRLGGAIPESFGRLASLEVLQLQNNEFNSYRNLANMQTDKLLVFDYDEEESEIDFKNFDFSRTRMADTKFEDDVDK